MKKYDLLRPISCSQCYRLPNYIAKDSEYYCEDCADEYFKTCKEDERAAYGDHLRDLKKDEV